MRAFQPRPVLNAIRPRRASRCRHLSVAAEQIEQSPRILPERVPIPHKLTLPPRQQDPHALVAPELAYIRKCMTNLLSAASPSLAQSAVQEFLHPTKQIRSLLVLLFAHATNGLGRNWSQKHWDAVSEGNMGRGEELDRPLTLPTVLNEWNTSMQDDTASFNSVFPLRSSIPRPSYPPAPPDSHQPYGTLVTPFLLPTQIRLAQIVEMIHVASLLHDCISQPAVNADSRQSDDSGFGNKLCILGGDFLLGRASTALSRLGESEVVELVASVISNLVEGELTGMAEIGTPELGRYTHASTSLEAGWDRYLHRSYLKTGSLMAKAARSSAVLGGCSGDDKWKYVAFEYGRHLGTACQLVDDSLHANQLQAGLATAPVLYAAEQHPQLLSFISRDFTQDGDLEQTVELVQASQGRERARLLAEDYAKQAKRVLHLLPESEARNALEDLTEVVVKHPW